MANKYIIDGKVAINEIVIDIKYRKLNREDILKLAEDPQIKDSFFGGEFRHKKPKSEWDKDYLNLVSCGAIAESFNLEYMLYLNEVAEYVEQVRKKKMIITKGVAIGAAVGVAAIIAGAVYLSTAKAETVNVVGEAIKRAVTHM